MNFFSIFVLLPKYDNFPQLKEYNHRKDRKLDLFIFHIYFSNDTLCTIECAYFYNLFTDRFFNKIIMYLIKSLVSISTSISSVSSFIFLFPFSFVSFNHLKSWKTIYPFATTTSHQSNAHETKHLNAKHDGKWHHRKKNE